MNARNIALVLERLATTTTSTTEHSINNLRIMSLPLRYHKLNVLYSIQHNILFLSKCMCTFRVVTEWIKNENRRIDQ